MFILPCVHRKHKITDSTKVASHLKKAEEEKKLSAARRADVVPREAAKAVTPVKPGAVSHVSSVGWLSLDLSLSLALSVSVCISPSISLSLPLALSSSL